MKKTFLLFSVLLILLVSLASCNQKAETTQAVSELTVYEDPAVDPTFAGEELQQAPDRDEGAGHRGRALAPGVAAQGCQVRFGADSSSSAC